MEMNPAANHQINEFKIFNNLYNEWDFIRPPGIIGLR